MLQYTTVNRLRPQQPPQKQPGDWLSSSSSSISFDTRGNHVLNGLQFETKSQADQIHIRVTATTESFIEKSPKPYDGQHENRNLFGEPAVSQVANWEEAVQEEERKVTPPKHIDSSSYTTTTYGNPIKLIITTSGALGHHNQPQHNYHDDVVDTAQGHTTATDHVDQNTVLGTMTNTAYDMGGYMAINDSEDEEGSYDDLGANMDLASLLAQHEANLDLDNPMANDDYDVGISSNNTTLKSAPTTTIEELQTTTPVASSAVPTVPEYMQTGEEEEPMVVEIMSDSLGGILMGGVGGDGGVTQFHDDAEEKQKEATMVKVSLFYTSQSALLFGLAN